MSEIKAFKWDELEFCSQEERISRLKQHVDQIVGHERVSFEAPGTPPEILEQFWRRIVEYEEKQLGFSQTASLPPVDFPDASSMDDLELHEVLWQKVNELAERRIFLDQTDHLSDRELYEVLSSVEMREATTEIVPENEAIHYDILGGYSEEDTQLYLKYYADEITREEWVADEPDYPLPDKETPPFTRDAKLPKPYFEQATSE